MSPTSEISSKNTDRSSGGWFKSPLSGKLFRYIFGSYFIITLVVTGIQLTVEYYHVRRNTFAELKGLAETFQPVLAESLWTFDDDALHTTLFSMLKLESVVGVKVTDPNGTILKTVGVVDADSQDIKSKSFLSKEIYRFETPLTFKDPAGEDKLLGHVTLISSSGVVINKIKYGFILIIINSVIKTTALWLIFVYFLNRIVSRPLTRLTQSVNEFELGKAHSDDDNLKRLSSRSDEIGMLSKRFNEMIAATGKMLERLKEQSRLEAIAKMARQVAHDIRSPLAALNVATSFISELDEDKRVLFRRAVHRIDDIASDLFNRSKPIQDGECLVENEDVDVHLVSEVIESIVSEKRLQFRTKHNIGVEFRIETANYGLFARINPILFKRILSNLINNSVDAIEGKDGHIDIKLSAVDHHVVISVTDNGKGIPPELFPRLMQEGATFGKNNGSGLGLFFAKKTIEEWNGSIEVLSTVLQGTEIRITLPRTEEPVWFVGELAIPQNTTVVILDDDDSIHEIWKGRLNTTEFKKLNVLHFRNPHEVVKWAESSSQQMLKAIYLCDYELIGYDLTGLDVIEKLGILNRSILVTSRFEEQGVRKTFISRNIRMIPKSLAGFVPIRLDSEKRRDIPEDIECVLLDDCPITRCNWELVARIQGKRLITFSHPSSLMEHLGAIPKQVSIYVDMNLSDGIKGDAVSRELFENGFENVYLSTGAMPSGEHEYWWVKGIIGKDPPFMDKRQSA